MDHARRRPPERAPVAERGPWKLKVDEVTRIVEALKTAFPYIDINEGEPMDEPVWTAIAVVALKALEGEEPTPNGWGKPWWNGVDGGWIDPA